MVWIDISHDSVGEFVYSIANSNYNLLNDYMYKVVINSGSG